MMFIDEEDIIKLLQVAARGQPRRSISNQNAFNNANLIHRENMGLQHKFLDKKKQSFLMIEIENPKMARRGSKR